MIHRTLENELKLDNKFEASIYQLNLISAAHTLRSFDDLHEEEQTFKEKISQRISSLKGGIYPVLGEN